MTLFLRQHVWAFSLSIVVGLCAVLPSILAPLAIGSAYKGIQYMPMDDEDFYRARIQEILDSHPAVVSPFVYEYKNESANIAPTGEWLYAAPAFVFRLPFIFVFYKFLLPATLFLLVYFLMRKLLDGEHDALLASITTGLLVTLGIDFVDYGYMFSLVHGAPPRALLWTRPVNPITGGVFLFSFLLFLCGIMERRKYAYVGAGILLALTIGYYFTFGSALAFLGALFVVYIVKRDYSTSRDFVLTGCVALLASAPYWLQVAKSFGGAEGRAASMRAGMIFTHAPVLNKSLFAATLVVGACFAYAYPKGYVREKERAWIFVVACIAAGWIAFNEQVLTGREIWYHHFVQYVVPLSFVAVLCAMHLSFRRAFPRLWLWGVSSLAVLCLVYGVYSTTGFHARLQSFERLQAYGSVMQWLNANAVRDCSVAVVEDGEEGQRLLPAYSHCNVRTSVFSFYAVPTGRVLNDYLLHLRLNGLAAKDAENYFKTHDSELRSYVYTDWNQLFDPSETVWLNGQIVYLTGAYKEFVKGNLNDQLHQYRVDYVMTKGTISPALQKQLPGIKDAADLGTYHIYSL